MATIHDRNGELAEVPYESLNIIEQASYCFQFAGYRPPMKLPGLSAEDRENPDVLNVLRRAGYDLSTM